MNASQDRLHACLADLAEDVAVVDLHERALRASRALSRRRAVTSVAVVAAVVAMGTGAAFAVLPRDRSTLVVATAPPSTASVSPATTPSPPVSGTPSDRASAAPSAQSGPTVPSLGALPRAQF
jgi:hypothetical protein